MSQSDTTSDDAQVTTDGSRDSDLDPVREANSHDVKPDADGDTSAARRLAADLPRDAPVSRVKQTLNLDHRQECSVWLDHDAGDSVTAPADWVISGVFVASSGRTNVRMVRDPRGD